LVSKDKNKVEVLKAIELLKCKYKESEDKEWQEKKLYTLLIV
jgi:hypothetical protein